jgi:cholesterol oxidase
MSQPAASRPSPGAANLHFDWIVVGSGFGGSVAALRLAEKGYRVAVLESGRRFREDQFAPTGWNLRRTFWAPRLGLRGPSRISIFKDIFIASGAGVGGGSLVYANTLYRAKPPFFVHEQWADLGDWAKELEPHYETVEHMLGVRTVPWDSDGQRLLRQMSRHFGVENTFTRTPCAVYFDNSGITVPDPYFSGRGPARTGCMRCGSCTMGCRVGAKNTLPKNYLWFAEQLGVTMLSETQVTDIRPLDGAEGRTGYEVTTERPGLFPRRTASLRAAGVVVAAGALGTNRLLAQCRLAGGLPRLSARLGEKVRTNSESILAVTLPDDSLKPAADVAISASIHVSLDTHLELVTYGERGSVLKFFFTLLTGDGTRLTRPLRLLAQILRHPLRFLKSLSPLHWGRRTVIVLVMQSLDNAMAFVPVRRWLNRRVRLTTRQDPIVPNPTFIPEGSEATVWLARHTGGIAQSMATEALFNIPTTAHILGGAVIGRDAASGVVDRCGRAFGYRDLIVCDGSVLPANPGVNPSLTITALAEHIMAAVPAKARRGDDANTPSAAGAPVALLLAA